MVKANIFRFIAMTMAVVMVAAMAGCKNTDSTQSQPKTLSYQVSLVNKAGTPMEKCSVEVYSDSAKTTLLYKGLTNSEGSVSFTAPESKDYVAVLSKLPNGYFVEESYKLTGERNTIVMTPGVMTDADMNNVRYSLGDAVLDFSVTAPDGTEFVLSELLQEKKAVVLNFWFLNCNPCKMEFPFIQEGYEQLSDDIAVLALNPYDGSDAEVAKFQSDNGYSFAMAKCDERWQDMMNIQSYPTTVIVDRYGNICLIHNGMIKRTQEFVDMVTYFVSDDYEQQFFRSAGQIPAVNN